MASPDICYGDRNRVRVDETIGKRQTLGVSPGMGL
jgi:hypothetical protein